MIHDALTIEPADSPPRLPNVLSLWLAWLVVALGLILLAHGCHGPDEDHELFAPHGFISSVRPCDSGS